jgi:hypothetical protein
MRRQDNQNQRDSRNNDWNRTNEHFSSDDRDENRSSRIDEYDRYGYNRNNDHSMSSDYGRRSDNDFRTTRYRESDSRDDRDEGHSFYHNNAGNYGMEHSHNSDGARNFDNNRSGSSRYGNASNKSFAEGDFRNTEPSSPHTGYYGKGPKGWKRSDERIKDEVCEVLYRDQHIDATNIEVAVQDGVVTLSGSIDTRWSKRHAEQRIEHLSGIEDVHNEIRVQRFDNSRH